MLILSIADVPAKLATWIGWFKALYPYLHTMAFRWVLGVLGLLISLAPWIVEFIKRRHSENKVSVAIASEKRLALYLIPHGENSPNVYLEVVNNGESALLSAQIRITGKSYGDGVKKFSYDGYWSDRTGQTYNALTGNHSKDYGAFTSIRIEKGKSALLRIAKMNTVNNRSISALSLVGIDEDLMWNFQKSETEPLPYFTLTVSIFGEGFTNTISRDFKIGPKTSYGPIEMAEVMA